MESPPVVIQPSVESLPIGWFLLLLIVAILIMVGIDYYADIANIKNNWSENRCQPYMMPFAGLFGYDMNENFNFCIQQIIKEQAKGVTGPFASGMSGMTGVLSGLMNSANSFRVMLATLVGGIIKVVAEFKSRITSLAARIKITAGRMKALMYRIYGTMFAVIYMALSAETALFNFGDTIIFKFLDTFCFPPEQPILLDNGAYKPISEVKVGDILVGGQIVYSTYTFASDGQNMVRLGEVLVSSNHFVDYLGRWVMAKDHPDALAAADWSGGVERPLCCLSTSGHRLSIGGYLFADYDETESANAATQAWVNARLNGVARPPTPHPDCSYDVGCPENTKIKTLAGWKALKDVGLGEQITARDRVVGIQISETADFCSLPDGQLVASGSLIWNAQKSAWLRAYSFLPRDTHNSQKVIALFVSPGAQMEIEGGHILRDAMEVYSPETKALYAEALLHTSPSRG
jgi:hypothetical protein